MSIIYKYCLLYNFRNKIQMQALSFLEPAQFLIVAENMELRDE
jgi:hypothetical protein